MSKLPRIACMEILNSKAILPPGSFAGSLRAYYILWDREDTLQYLVSFTEFYLHFRPFRLILLSIEVLYEIVLAEPVTFSSALFA